MRRVDIEYVMYLIEERNKINSLNLEEIEFYFGNKKLDIPEEVIEEFMFTGLNNTDFIVTEYYERTLDDEEEDGLSLTDRLDRDDSWFHDADMEAR